MKYYTKRKIQKWFQEKWKWLLGSGIFLTIGLVIMIVGMEVSGWSVIKWLQSPWAVTTFVFLIGGAFLLIMAFLIKKQADILK